MSEKETEYSDEQFSQSMDDALIFLDENILEPLIDFDYNNPDKDYVAGSATYALFIEVLEILKESGYTLEDIQKVIQDNEEMPASTILH
jgi:hypothetical protein